jgi:serine-type D-Ala-D-Ala carboxypeptidase (penicillin-binding protein 5/6)
LVILSRHTPDERITLPALPAYKPEDERIGLFAGESYTVGDLVQAALINSANDAADALALYDAGAIPKFAARMNAKMTEWGITSARFSNPTGLFDNDNNASTEALGKIAGLALTNAFLRQTILKPEAAITSATGRVINLVSTNKLLATGQFYGIKTGYTPAAGECFVGLTRINGHEVITVVLGAGDRFGATQSLANWISRNYQWL